MQQQIDFTFHNSTGLSGTDLQSATAKAQSQKEVVYEYLQKYPDVKFTTHQIDEVFIRYCKGNKRCKYNIPHDSIKRSLSDLAKEGLIMHDKSKLIMSRYGKGCTRYYYSTQNH